MCDERTIRDVEDRWRLPGRLTRRELGALSAGAGVAMLLPRAAGALEVTAGNVDVSTPDGTADCHFVHPSSGAHPGVLIWPDALGLRPAFDQIARRLAESGYAVLVVNPCYRSEPVPEPCSPNYPKARRKCASSDSTSAYRCSSIPSRTAAHRSLARATTRKSATNSSLSRDRVHGSHPRTEFDLPTLRRTGASVESEVPLEDFTILLCAHLVSKRYGRSSGGTPKAAI